MPGDVLPSCRRHPGHAHTAPTPTTTCAASMTRSSLATCAEGTLQVGVLAQGPGRAPSHPVQGPVKSKLVAGIPAVDVIPSPIAPSSTIGGVTGGTHGSPASPARYSTSGRLGAVRRRRLTAFAASLRAARAEKLVNRDHATDRIDGVPARDLIPLIVIGPSGFHGDVACEGPLSLGGETHPVEDAVLRRERPDHPVSPVSQPSGEPLRQVFDGQDVLADVRRSSVRKCDEGRPIWQTVCDNRSYRMAVCLDRQELRSVCGREHSLDHIGKAGDQPCPDGFSVTIDEERDVGRVNCAEDVKRRVSQTSGPTVEHR